MSPMARMWPGMAVPRAISAPWTRIVYVEAGRSMLSRVRTRGSTTPEVHGHLAPEGLDPVQEVAAAAGVDQFDQVVGHFQFQGVDLHVAGQPLGGVGSTGGRDLGRGLVFGPVPQGVVARQARRGQPDRHPDQDEGELGQPGDEGQQRDPGRRRCAGHGAG